MGAGEVQQLQAGVYTIGGQKYKLSEEDLKKLSGEITQNELQALLSGKEVTANDFVETGLVGTRGLVKTNENRADFSITKATEPLVDDDGKAIKDTQEKRYEEIKAKFKAQDADMTQDQILNEAVETEFGPMLDKHKQTVAGRANPNINKMAYYDLVLTDEERAKVDKKTMEQNKRIAELMGIPDENGNIKQLTPEEQQELEQLKLEYEKRFPKDLYPDNNDSLKENQTFDLRGVKDPAIVNQRTKQAIALSKMLAVEEAIQQRGQASGDENATGELTDKQIRELARAEIKEQITHDHQIRQIEDKLAKDKKLTEKERAKLQKTITNLKEDSENKIQDINEVRAHEYAEAQLEWDTYEQNFKNTVVSWDKKDMKAAEEKNPAANNTYLKKEHQEIIKRQPEKFGCHKAGAGETPTFTDENGQAWVFDSEDYKQAMLRMSNSQESNTDATMNADYYASTSEFVELATANKNAEAAEKSSDKKRAKAKAKPATVGERRDARQMFAIAGIQVAGDNTYKKRGKEIGKAALAGAGAGGLAALGGELYKSLSTVKYAGTVLSIVSGVVNTTVSGTGTTTVEGTVGGKTTVTGDISGEISGDITGTVTGDISGEISGDITGTVTGDITGEVTGTGYNRYESIQQEYDPLTGTYMTTGHQVTETPVTLTGTGTGTGTGIGHGTGTGIGHGTGTGVGHGKGTGIGHGKGSAEVEWTDNYKKDVTYEYQEEVSVEYEDEREVPYSGQTRPKFEPINILKGAAAGAISGAGFKAVSYLFKKKTDADYANDETVADKYRSNVGYEVKAEPDAVAELEVETAVAPELCPAEVDGGEQETEVKIENHPYKLKATYKGGNRANGETLDEVIRAKYHITNNRDAIAARREIRRLMGLPESGAINGKTVTPHIEVNGETWKDAYWLPDTILDGKYKYDPDAEVDRVDYTMNSIAKQGKNTAQVSTTMSGHYVVTDACGNKLYEGSDKAQADKICQNHNAEQARIRAEWNAKHPLDQI